MTEVPGEAFKGENVQYLMSLDLSYNKIKDLPYEFHGAHMPYLYGVDLSYNRFDHFPFEPFDAASLTMLAVRGQRDVPVPPMIPTVSPDFISRFTPVRQNLSASLA